VREAATPRAYERLYVNMKTGYFCVLKKENRGPMSRNDVLSSAMFRLVIQVKHYDRAFHFNA
jgi:hypothetical protein